MSKLIIESKFINSGQYKTADDKIHKLVLKYYGYNIYIIQHYVDDVLSDWQYEITFCCVDKLTIYRYLIEDGIHVKANKSYYFKYVKSYFDIYKIDLNKTIDHDDLFDSFSLIYSIDINPRYCNDSIISDDGNRPYLLYGDQKNGTSIRFYENTDQLMYKHEYRNGKLIYGVGYHRNGKMSYEEKWNLISGKRIIYKRWTKDGELYLSYP